ncbi:Phosphatidate cytidylyltransferase [Candidatus Terasakiella magnetica]|nr:Phosphatidate cytidylyltransferase [Candidatus Terasakiella magnetica]
MAVTAAMAAQGDGRVLKTRIISAAFLAPPAVLAAWMGGYAFALLVAVAVALMCWEWHRMVGAGVFGLAGKVAGAGCAGAVMLAVSHPVIGCVLAVAAAAASVMLTEPQGRRWAGAGAIYAGLPSVTMVWLREMPENGGALIGWLLMVVWATDIGAYAFGRLIGGPLLLPVVSPKKTWAGLLGGMLCAGLVGAITANLLGQGNGIVLALVSAVTAVVAQIGDLFESWVKRRWGVKDSSTIIPGHGGVLDRVDGLLSASLVVAALVLITGRTVLAWQ